MHQQYTHQLDAIHTLLEQGHNSIKLEKHVLPLWSVVIGFLVGFVAILADFLKPNILPDTQAAHILFVETFVTTSVLITIAVDRYITIYNRRKRDESISIIQKNISYINWLVSGLGVLLMFFAEEYLFGSHMIFGLFIVIFGFCLYVFGLFSDSWLRWSGVVFIVLGIFSLFFLKHTATQIFTACSFIIGGLLVQLFHQKNKSLRQHIAHTIIWVSSVIVGYLIFLQINQMLYINSDQLPRISLEQYQNKQHPKNESFRVNLPKGTTIPMHYALHFNLFNDSISDQWELTLAKSVDLVLVKGKLNGVYRIGNDRWRHRRESFYVRSFSQTFSISENNIPTISRKISLHSNRKTLGLDL